MDLPAAARADFRRLAASLRLRFMLRFSKYSRCLISASIPSCCTRLLKRFSRLSKLSLSPALTWVK